MHTTKNYSADGGSRLVVGGTQEVLSGATVTVKAGATFSVEEGATVTGMTAEVGAATATVLGGVKAATKGAGDTVECKMDGTSKKLYVPTYPTVPVAAKVAAAAGEAPTKAEFDALITALVTAGLMAAE